MSNVKSLEYDKVLLEKEIKDLKDRNIGTNELLKIAKQNANNRLRSSREKRDKLAKLRIMIEDYQEKIGRNSFQDLLDVIDGPAVEEKFKLEKDLFDEKEKGD